MKKIKILGILSIILLLNSCGANPAKYMNSVMEKVYIGMPLNEFRDKIEGEELVEMKPEITIFKIEKKTYNDIVYATSGNGWRSDHRFFYFVNNKLQQVDKGERAVDYRVKIDK